MRSLASIIATLAWGLWAGGLVALFIFVQTLFTRNREVAIVAAPQMFLAFQKYHLMLAAVAVIATVAWRIVAPSKAVLVIFILLGVAACAGVAVAIGVIGPMEELRMSGQSGSPEFKRLHGISMMLYTIQGVMLLITGVILPFAIRGSGVGTSPETDPASGAQV